MNALARQILSACRAQSWTVTTAESCTGGMVATALTEIAGSSDVFNRGYVTYSNTAKIEMLGVSQSTLNDFGAVSEQVAKEMAQAALSKANADIAVSITGIAGPGPSEHKPEGRVCFGLAQKSKITATTTVEFEAVGRSNVRAKSTDYALNLILNAAK